MSRESDHLTWLQDWVRREFGEGPLATANPWVQIETLDPGWAVTISLTGTAMESIDFPSVEVERAEADWIHCWIDGDPESRYLEWQGRGGSANLEEMLGMFRAWVEGRNMPVSADAT